MNKYRVEILPLAWNDLREIGEYITQNDPAAANRVVEKLIASLQRLETFPLSAPFVPDTELSKEGYRVLVCDKYLCFYRVEDKKVFVYHIAHGAMNYPVLFRSLSSKKTEE
ncbi:MAG: type II toxin-antitoxin system RelE/ParE family toxin [Candidatus Methanoplasma sp.]|nr:type II toxin-antitoxin system RelE/ParE family toxin [Candidatus Methanoplasma sp.]